MQIYIKKDFLQALGTNHTAKDLNTISFKLGDENIELPINKLKEEQFKYSNINAEILADHDVAMNRFTTSARQSNFTGAQVDNMVSEFLINQPESVKRDLAYNYYQKDEDDKNKDVETFLKERMKNKIQSGYAYKQPEVEVEEKETETDTPYFLAQKDMLDKIISSFVGPKTFGGKAGSPGIEYYQTAKFENMLPPALKLVKSTFCVIIYFHCSDTP